MSSPSRSEPPVELDLDAPLPATWSLTALLVALHGLTAVAVWGLGRAPLWAALLMDRGPRFRVDVGGQEWGRVASGELWRLCTSVLLHGDALHLAFNAVGLLALGRLLEPWLGPRRLVAWFVLGGVAGSVASQIVGVRQSDGASGGAFALMGAAVVLGWRLRDALPAWDRRILGPVLWAFLALNIALSLAIPFIDAAGHLGGLAAGLGVAALCTSSAPVVRAVEWSWIATFAAACAYGWTQGVS